MPDERYRAVVMAENLLLDIIQPGNRVPKEYKDRARSALRHYPSTWDLNNAARQAPDVFQEKMEDVIRMIKKYEQGKTNEA